MQIYDKDFLGRIAKENGFQRDTLEKVIRLKEILRFFNENNILSEHLLLKGGTAINLTIFNLPRLSVDIDMDFTPNVSKEDMHLIRRYITKTINSYMEDEGYILSPKSRFHHSLDAFYYEYINAGGNKDIIKLELNYSLRAHIFDGTDRKILSDIIDADFSVRSLNPLEIFAAKCNALLNRAAPRDLFDWNNLVTYNLFAEEHDLFRKCIIFYASISAEKINKEFDISAIDKITFADIKRELFPVIREKVNFDLEEQKNQAKNVIKELMCLTEQEKEYLNRFELKEYRPELLFDDDKIIENIIKHPMALWKCK